jgi:hypothetical protein
MKRIISLIVFFSAMVFSAGASVFAADEQVIKIDDEKALADVADKRPEVAGELFGQPVSTDNYLFAKAAASIFGGSWGPEVKTPGELEDRTWEDLLLSYEAFRRNIIVPQEKVDEEMGKLLKEEKVDFDWKKDPQAFDKWTRERVREPAVLFENQLKHLIQLQLLKDAMRKSFEPRVTEEEALQKYLNEYNTLELEMVKFDDLKEAEDFYGKMKNPKLWDKEAKNNPKFSLKTGFVSLEWLIEAWKIPRDDCYAMLDVPVNSIYKPTPIYKGYAVYRVLQQRKAVKEEFASKREEYLKKVKVVKQFEELNAWQKKLKDDARIQVFLGSGRRAP